MLCGQHVWIINCQTCGNYFAQKAELGKKDRLSVSFSVKILVNSNKTSDILHHLDLKNHLFYHYFRYKNVTLQTDFDKIK